MIAWPSRRRGLDPREAKSAQIKRIDESIDRTNRIDLVDEVIEAFGQQRRLPTVHPFNEALHPIPPQCARESYRPNHMKRGVFTQPGSKSAVPVMSELRPLLSHKLTTRPTGSRRAVDPQRTWGCTP